MKMMVAINVGLFLGFHYPEDNKDNQIKIKYQARYIQSKV